MTQAAPLQPQFALVTGGALRLGAAIATSLHQAGFNLFLHYRRSTTAAHHLADNLNRQRPDSVTLIQAELGDTAALPQLLEQLRARTERLDVLVNNASAYYPTTAGHTSEQQWDDLMAGNMKGPYFLTQACLPLLRRAEGNIINLVDINAIRPLREHTVYCMAKAGLLMMTRSLALDLAPDVRVNAVAPGTILWPNGDSPEVPPAEQQRMLAQIPMGRIGTPQDIADTVLFLARASYITGQVIAVDGGRML